MQLLDHACRPIATLDKLDTSFLSFCHLPTHNPALYPSQADIVARLLKVDITIEDRATTSGDTREPPHPIQHD